MGRHSRPQGDRPDTGETTFTTGNSVPFREALRPAPPRAAVRRSGPSHAAGPPSAPPGGPGVRGGHPVPGGVDGGRGPVRGAGYGRGLGRGVAPEAAAAGPMAVPEPSDEMPGPRPEYVEAFEEGVFGTAGAAGAEPRPGPPAAAGAGGPGDHIGTGASGAPAEAEGPEGPGGAADSPDRADASGPGGGRPGGGSRTLTGVAAAAVTTVLAVVVAGQLTGGGIAGGWSADEENERTNVLDKSRSDISPKQVRRTPAPSYAARMSRLHELPPDFKGSGELVPVPGRDEAPGSGERIRYRVDVEEGLPLDGRLFAEAVHRTLNDERSWSHGGARTFERVPGGGSDFVITLASPSTTGVWCAKSGLDTTVQNVSCDSALTERIMINAYRWAHGSETFGPKLIRQYREMLINHEVGHRLGKGHVGCPEDGEPAPVMMQQTKTLTTGGATCRPNAWPFPDA